MRTGAGHRTVATALGELTLCGEGETLTGVWFPAHRPAPDPARLGPPAPTSLTAAAAALVAYLAGDCPELAVDHVLPTGPPLHRAVWELIAAIPRGGTRTYASLAAQLSAHPRAVGGAVARNPLSIVVPCHRVIGSDGSLTGYAGGLARKRALLVLEGALPTENLPKSRRISHR